MINCKNEGINRANAENFIRFMEGYNQREINDLMKKVDECTAAVRNNTNFDRLRAMIGLRKSVEELNEVIDLMVGANNQYIKQVGFDIDVKGQNEELYRQKLCFHDVLADNYDFAPVIHQCNNLVKAAIAIPAVVFSIQMALNIL